MVKELAPIIEKVLVIEFFIELIAVVIPTNAIRPIAMIIMVRIVLSGLDLIESHDIRRFSRTKAPARIRYIFSVGISF
jgi:hypothetical protein